LDTGGVGVGVVLCSARSLTLGVETPDPFPAEGRHRCGETVEYVIREELRNRLTPGTHPRILVDGLDMFTHAVDRRQDLVVTPGEGPKARHFLPSDIRGQHSRRVGL
jgi:hypothetical protein